jgi:antitoxin FitA
MSRMIQIRNVPDDLHRELRTRAAREGMSLSGYLLEELRRLSARPSPREYLERLARRGRVPATFDSVEAVRALREGGE